MQLLKNHKDFLSISIYLIVFLFIVSSLQKLYDTNTWKTSEYEFVINNEDKYILPAFIVKNFSFGFNAVLADAYWIMAIQDLSTWNRKTDFYYKEYENVATLDPRFAYPYLFGILVTASKKYPDSVNKIEPIAKIGIENIPFNWEIPFYLGSQFNLLKEYQKAFHYLEVAAKRPIVPQSVQKAYDLYGKKKVIDTEATRSIMKAMYETTESTTTKKIIRTGLISEELNTLLKDPLNQYKKENGTYPTSLDELIKANIIQVSPSILADYNIRIDQLTGLITIKPKSK